LNKTKIVTELDTVKPNLLFTYPLFYEVREL